MIITKKLFDDLSYEAVKSSILRVNYDLRNSDCEQSQRMLNALRTWDTNFQYIVI